MYLEHRGSRILRNIGTLATDSAASHHSLGFATNNPRQFSVPY